MRAHTLQVRAVALSAVSQLSATALLGVSAWLLSRAAEHPTASALTLGAVAVRTLSLVRALSRYGERLVGHDAALRRTADLRVAAYAALRHQPPARAGEALGTVLSDVDAAQDLMLRTRLPAWSALVVTTACTGVVALLLPAALPLVLAGLLLGLLVVPALALRAGRGERDLSVRRQQLQLSALELLRAGAELTVLGRVEERLAAASWRGAELERMERSAAQWAVLPALVAGAVQAVVTAGVVVVGAEAVRSGQLARVHVAVVVLVTLAAFEPLAALRDAASRLPAQRGPVRRLAALLAVPGLPTSATEPATSELRLLAAGLVTPPLHELDLRVLPGRSLALVGPSGAGKSTVLDLLSGRIAPDSGAVLAGGVPVALLDEVVRSRLVVVAEQQPFLFAASLRDNLRVARPDAPDELLRQALGTVGLGPWLDGLPAGLGTPVGELGEQLSGGQRTRVGVARALLSPAPLVLLDEPTEGLSPAEGAALVHEVLQACRGRGVVLVTHREEELGEVDEVVAVRDGRLVPRQAATPPVTA